jgi:hypothetical protein
VRSKVGEDPGAGGCRVSEQAPSHPTKRTRGLIEDEIAELRVERDEHIANAQLRLVGECCADLEQLTRELAITRG